jgi:hypothetical protein
MNPSVVSGDHADVHLERAVIQAVPNVEDRPNSLRRRNAISRWSPVTTAALPGGQILLTLTLPLLALGLLSLGVSPDRLATHIRRLGTRAIDTRLIERGFGPLTAGKLIGEIAGGRRFTTNAKLARAGGIAPIPAIAPPDKAAAVAVAPPADVSHGPGTLIRCSWGQILEPTVLHEVAACGRGRCDGLVPPARPRGWRPGKEGRPKRRCAVPARPGAHNGLVSR